MSKFSVKSVETQELDIVATMNKPVNQKTN